MAPPGPYRRQQGAILFLFATLVTIMIVSTVAAVLAGTMAASRANIVARKKAWLTQQAQVLRQFYRLHAASMDGTPGSQWTSGTALARAAGIQLKYRAQIIIGSRQQTGNLDYRNLTLWIPNAESARHDGFKPSRALTYAVIKGLPIEQRLETQADHQLSDLDSELTAYYAGRIDNDPAHSASVDYWSPLGCGQYGGGDWNRCATGWTALTTMAAPALGLPHPMKDPWGLAVQGINAAPQAQTSTPPFTLLLRSRYPWGGADTTTVVEPVNAG